MTNFATSKIGEIPQITHKIKLSNNTAVIGQGRTLKEAIKDAEGKAKFLDRNYQ
jgi:hypothetical protein